MTEPFWEEIPVPERIKVKFFKRKKEQDNNINTGRVGQ